MERVLVTGGLGFIGSDFVHLSTQRGHSVTVLDARTYAANPANIDGTGATDITGDICDAALVEELVAAHDLVVHFAAESHNDNSLSNPYAFERSNVLGTLTLAHTCARVGVKMHHISTDEVFGDLPLDSTARFTPTTAYNPSSPYSASKAASDHFVRAAIRSHGLCATISNCSNNYGPRQHPEKFIPRQIIHLLRGEQPRLYGAGDNIRDWIHVRDHNTAVWDIIDKGTPGRTYLIGADGEHSNRAVVEMLLAAFGRDPHDFLHVADRPGHDRRYAIDPTSTRELGWRPHYTDFAQGLHDTIDWYANNTSWWEDAFAASEATYRAKGH